MPMFSKEDLYNDRGVPKTREIFVQGQPFTGPLTLRKEPHDGKISLYKLYMSFCVEDPTEVTFAEEVFGDLSFWMRMQEVYILRPHLEEWRMLAAEKRKQIAFKSIMAEAKDGKSSFAAAKYLIEEPWKHGNSIADKKRIKKQIMETADAAFQSKEVQSDIARLKQEGILN